MTRFIMSLDETFMHPKDVSDVVLIGDSTLPADPPIADDAAAAAPPA